MKPFTKPPTLYIVCDSSGSMSEDDKFMLTRGIVRAVEQYIRLGYGAAEVKLVRWNARTIIIDWNPDDEFPSALLKCQGMANQASLLDFIGSVSDDKILLLTDACWSKNDVIAMRNLISELPPDTIRIVKIGNDSALFWQDNEIFATDEFFLILDNWLPVANNDKNDNEEDEWQ